MARYIDADELMKCFENVTLDNGVNMAIDRYAIKCINEQPTADVRENVYGKWMPIQKGEWIASIGHSVFTGHECSLCGYLKSTEYMNFCPNCGADMRGEGND